MKRILALVTDAYGGSGGIAKFNRDLLGALASMPEAGEIVCVPRVRPCAAEGAVPAKVNEIARASGGIGAYLRELVANPLVLKRFDLVLCAHVNLLPLAAMLALRDRAPLVLTVHGIDVWRPTWRGRVFARAVTAFVSVSEHTRRRFLEWSRIGAPSYILPNCVDLERYAPGPKPEALLRRWNLAGRKVLLTVGRLSAAERYKGFDSVIAVLPRLAARHPGIAYLIAGDGDDRPRLERLARERGVAERVIFAGFVPEEEKPELYRAADAYVMPGSGEGFGIVYLEALASGLPVLGGKTDASPEVLQGGGWGALADRGDLDDVERGILATLENPVRVPRAELQKYSAPAFASACRSIFARILHPAS